MLYLQAAAGIAADSVPELKWQQTEAKSHALIRATELVEQGFYDRTGMNTTARHALRIFLTGLLAALPLAATLLIFIRGARVLYCWLNPGSFVDGLLIALGLGGAGSEVVGYLLGLAIVLLGIFALGLLVQTRLRGVLARTFNNVMQRVPLVRNV